MEKAIETRGRKRKYEFNLKRGEVKTMPENKSAHIIALKTAKIKGWKFRTWTIKGQLNIKRVK